jgi:hypothetical protein
MIILLIVVLIIIFFIVLVIRRDHSQLPYNLKGKRVRKYIDLLTERDVYIAVKREKASKRYINEAFYVDDGSTCEQALYKKAYGYVYFEKGEVKIVSKSFAFDLLTRIQNIETYRAPNKQKIARDISSGDINN